MRELEIYVHIPFCAKKCAYCDFLSFPASEAVQERYFSALRNEINAFSGTAGASSAVPENSFRVISVFFGGGTPSLPAAEHVTGILDLIRRRFPVAPGAEITIECNPGTLTEGKLSAYRRAGFNRLSLGLQSADNTLLRTLGRIHTWERFEEEFTAARKAGFDNLSVDLMYALPGQTKEQWAHTLDAVFSLPGPELHPGGKDHSGPEHLSAYSLIIEEGTPFWELYHADAMRREEGDRPLILPDEDAEAWMLDLLKEKAAEAGMHRYEISNYARTGFESVHNTGYWLRREYAGFGLGASGFIGRERYRNTEDLAAYLSGDCAEQERRTLSAREEMEEFMFLGLRRTEGVDPDRFRQCFGSDLSGVYGPVIQKFLKIGLLEWQSGRLRLTEHGMDVSNIVMREFLL